MSDLWPWLALAGLGAYHGLNPAMGWLFAVSRGMQQRSRRAVVESLWPIALGHELAIGVAAVIALAFAAAVDSAAFKITAAAVLLGFGVLRFVKPRLHPRWTTMRVDRRELTLWSFLMSTAHGAGLIVAPVLVGIQGSERGDSGGAAVQAGLGDGSFWAAAAGAGLHVAAMLAVMGLVAVFVYEKVGVEVLRRAWVNTDQIWAGAFVVAAGLTLFT